MNDVKFPMTFENHINGLPLPPDLLALMNAGNWECPADLTAWNRLFPYEHGSDPNLYAWELMKSENKSWLYEQRPMFLGALDAVKMPGDINPKLSVLIGDLGIGSDQPIALDYRLSREKPCVLTLEWSAYPANNRWIEIAPHILAFAELIGLSRQCDTTVLLEASGG